MAEILRTSRRSWLPWTALSALAVAIPCYAVAHVNHSARQTSKPAAAAPSSSPSRVTPSRVASPPAAASAANPPTPYPVMPSPPGALSDRIVAYSLDARLDPATHSIQASETLDWKNITGQPQQDLPFHLYLNAFQPTSTWIAEARRSNPGFEWKPENYGSIQITAMDATGVGDLKPSLHFIQPDDNNRDDHTVAQIHLPTPVPAGGHVVFHIQFKDQLPQVVARTGYLRDFYMIGQWFPKIGVWWHGAWNCHQFHDNTEFFADFGTFDVRVTVPQNYVVGAGGDLASETANNDGSKTLHFTAADTHDFSWTASPSFRVVTSTWQGSGGSVAVRMLMSPDHQATDDRYMKSIKGTLETFDKWYGQYPYDRITIVDPPHGGFAAGGMEYPTLITADTDRLIPRSAMLPEIVLEHEFGHQYWYGMVATNEFEEAWLDEGINSYTEVKVMDHLYGRNTSFLNLPFATLSEDEAERMMYLGTPDYDPLTRFAWKFVNGPSYGSITYGKTATALLTLEKIVGEDTMRRAVQTWFQRYRFTHPIGTDFLNTVNEVAGQNLDWYFNQAVSGTKMLDYAVEMVQSDPLDWYQKHPSTGKGAQYRSYVVVHRIGDFAFPTDLRVKFDDGEVVHEQWDGQDRWIRYSYVKLAKIVSAEIDPEHQVLLDRNFYNNSYTVRADGRARNKLTVWSTFVRQWMFQLCALLT
jgi:hypothetical protein